MTRNRSRCDRCQRRWTATHPDTRGSATARGYDTQWQRIARQAVAEHRAYYGDWCPGWRREPHGATDLTGDHIVPKSLGGTNTRANVRVLCRSCNSARRAGPAG